MSSLSSAPLIVDQRVLPSANGPSLLSTNLREADHQGGTLQLQHEAQHDVAGLPPSFPAASWDMRDRYSPALPCQSKATSLDPATPRGPSHLGSCHSSCHASPSPIDADTPTPTLVEEDMNDNEDTEWATPLILLETIEGLGGDVAVIAQSPTSMISWVSHMTQSLEATHLAAIQVAKSVSDLVDSLKRNTWDNIPLTPGGPVTLQDAIATTFPSTARTPRAPAPVWPPTSSAPPAPAPGPSAKGKGHQNPHPPAPKGGGSSSQPGPPPLVNSATKPNPKMPCKKPKMTIASPNRCQVIMTFKPNAVGDNVAPDRTTLLADINQCLLAAQSQTRVESGHMGYGGWILVTTTVASQANLEVIRLGFKVAAPPSTKFYPHLPQSKSYLKVINILFFKTLPYASVNAEGITKHHPTTYIMEGNHYFENFDYAPKSILP
ncbi:hypothetical protein P691DRAFT_790122 [Macrolepiota fuliginosa MF-IS2]|uniref:Uncharacterized protein n=1 Tax=Macrolepiota fuliginosa MF-IS2 TaxID=1400762 RepID=A0A9P6BY22_9AGAR|nr:hypothetical protein P691DRAFT_790122 [Macrolepiota fuliginosa MF-IS2]